MPSWDERHTIETNSGDYYARFSNYAKLCNATLGEHLRYLNTPQTAADMNDILAAIGQDEMNYYGTSYGTILGTTYAQLFPEKVNRMVIDGVVNYRHHWEFLENLNSLDLDAVWDSFLSHCLAESTTCPLADGFSSVASLRSAIKHKLDAMDVDPAGVYINATAYGMLRGGDVRSSIFQRLYSPRRWPYLARSLSWLLSGDYTTPYMQLFGGVAPKNPRIKHAPNSVTTFQEMSTNSGQGDGNDAGVLIRLGDKIPANQVTRRKQTRQEIVDKYTPWAGYMAKDVGPILEFAAETWLLPRSHDLRPASHIKTAHPVLILSNRLDPVTPLRSAQASNRILHDSVLLVQDGIGHCTVSKSSRCTARHMRAYFNAGTLPPKDTICQVDAPYFPDPDLEVAKIAVPAVATKTTTEHDAALDAALLHLAKFIQHI